MLAPVVTAAILAFAPYVQETTMHARGAFDVTITPVAPADGAAADLPGRMVLSKTFKGDIDGVAYGEMLGVLAGQSGAYVALERVRGTVAGRSGTFALVHRGVMTEGAQDLSISIVPGSGTGDLSGIQGVFHLTIEGGAHSYDLEYSLPEP